MTKRESFLNWIQTATAEDHLVDALHGFSIAASQLAAACDSTQLKDKRTHLVGYFESLSLDAIREISAIQRSKYRIVVK